MRAAVFPIITQAKNTVNDNFPPRAVWGQGGLCTRKIKELQELWLLCTDGAKGNAQKCIYMNFDNFLTKWLALFLEMY